MATREGEGLIGALGSATVRALLIWIVLAFAALFMLRFTINLVIDLFDTP